MTTLQWPLEDIAARYYVRAGMDPNYETVEALDALVWEILHLPVDLGNNTIGYLSPGDRAVVAVDALRGWTEHRGADRDFDRDPLVWHRLIASNTSRTVVEVCAS